MTAQGAGRPCGWLAGSVSADGGLRMTTDDDEEADEDDDRGPVAMRGKAASSSVLKWLHGQRLDCFEQSFHGARDEWATGVRWNLAAHGPARAD